MAPEVVLCETMKDNPYEYKADVWSLGTYQIFKIILVSFSILEISLCKYIVNRYPGTKKHSHQFFNP